ncbi:unnamed protein product [Prunus armeniaca]|uniref:Uncharacterized protein n=1 Tax=Prunus armeniaca TaxID=36596 RepID=A0A6J5VJ87_PRUAR|nr:unnamed protein product [Prunus armeniaca]
MWRSTTIAKCGDVGHGSNNFQMPRGKGDFAFQSFNVWRFLPILNKRRFIKTEKWKIKSQMHKEEFI